MGLVLLRQFRDKQKQNVKTLPNFPYILGVPYVIFKLQFILLNYRPVVEGIFLEVSGWIGFYPNP